MSASEITYLTDVTLLTCVVQPGHAEDIIKAARDVGATAGAITYHARGVGTRERLGILGVAVEAERDVINILVADDQKDLVFETLYRAGKLATPGMGFIYTTPLEKFATYVPESIRARLDKAK
jgi:nitrogen regulatory protein PII